MKLLRVVFIFPVKVEITCKVYGSEEDDNEKIEDVDVEDVDADDADGADDADDDADAADDDRP